MPIPPRVMPALVTPFDADGELDIGAHAHNVGFLSDVGIEGFVLGGSNGEGPYLETGERGRLIEEARQAAPEAFVMAGVMAETVRGGLRQLEECGGADSVLVLTPTTMARNRSPYILNYFRRMADASELPVYLYSVPPNTAYSMPVELVAELAEHPNVVGMKDSSGDVVRLQAIVNATGDDFVLYSGASAAVTAAITVGCHGVITGSANYVPRLVKDTVEKVPALDLQRQLNRISAAVESHGVPGVKAAATAAGLKSGYPRLPLEPVPAELASELAALVSD
ncbi:MAG: dihydrodipicolinate synthase family protein [Acidimicrobiia bacterium]